MVRPLLALIAACTALYSPESKVMALDGAQIREKVLKSTRVWLVEFYAPWCGHCKALAPEYQKVAKALEGIAIVGAVDADADKTVGGTYGIKGFPTIKLFGLDKSKPIDYNGPRTAAALVDFVLGQIRGITSARLNGRGGNAQGHASSANVQELTASTFASQVAPEEKWMVMFYAPWCGHCKNAMPHFEAAAGDALKTAKFGRVNCDEHKNLCTEHGVQGFPTVKLFSGGSSEQYDGPRSREAFAEFAQSKSRPSEKQLELGRLSEQRVFNEYCQEFEGLCLIALLPDVRDAGVQKREEQLQDLREVRKANARNAISFLWAAGGEQLALEERLGLNFGYPSLVAIHAGKKKFAIMRKRYERASIDKFIGELLAGDASVQDLPALPTVRSVGVNEEL